MTICSSILPRAIRVLSLISALSLLLIAAAFGQSTFTGTGNWSNAGNWSAGVPNSGVAAIIAAGASVTVDVAADAASLTINAGAITTVTISGTNSLTVAGAITMNQPTSNGANTIAVGTGTLTAASLTMENSGNGQKDCQVTLSTGTITITGNVTMKAAFTKNYINLTGAGTLNIGGNVDNGAGAVGGGFTAPNASSIINLNGSSGAQTVFLYGGGTTLGILKINNAFGVTSGSTMTAGTLTIGDITSNSSFSDGGFQLTSTGTLNLVSGTYTLGATTSTTFPAFGTRNISSGTTIVYASAAAQTVSTTPAYQHLIFSGAGTKTTAAGTLSIAGDWTIGSTAALNTNNTIVSLTGNLTKTANLTTGTGAIGIGGNWTSNGGTFTQGTGVVTLSGTSKVISGSTATTFAALTISGTVTSSQSFSASGNLTVNGTFTPAAADVISGGGTLTGTGTVYVTRTAATADLSTQYSITGKTLTNLTVEYAGASAQTVSALTYGTLRINNASGVTSAGAVTVNGNLDIANGSWNDNGSQITGNGTGTFTMATGTSLTLGSAGAATLFPTNFTAGNTTLSGTSTVTYNSGVAQTVSITPNYRNVIFSGAGTKTTAAGTFTVGGDWTIGSTTALNTNNTVVSLTGNLTKTGNLTTGTGAIGIAGNWTSNGGTLTQGAGIVTLSGSGAVISGSTPTTFNALTISGTVSSTQSFSASGNLTVNGTFTPDPADVISGSGTLTGSGTVYVTRTAATPDFSSQYSITGLSLASLTVEYNSSSAQTISAVNYGNLVSSSSGARTLASTGTIGISGTFTQGSNTYTVTGSTVNFNNATGGQTIPAFNYHHLTVSNTSGTTTLAGSGTIGIAGTFTPGNQTFSITGSTIEYNNASGGQTVAAFMYNNLTVSNSSGTTTLAGSGTIGIAGTFSPGSQGYASSGSTVNFNNAAGGQTVPAINYNNLTVSNASGTTTLAGSGTIGIAGTFTPGTQAYSITGSTIDFNSSTGGQTIPAFNFNNLTVSNSSGSTTLINGGTIGVAGTFTPGGQTFTVTGNTFLFNGVVNQSLASAFTFNNLTINNASGVTLSGNATVNTTLTLTSGTITTGANTVIIGSSGTISRTSGHIVGNLQKPVPTGTPSPTFEIGDASYYTPISLSFANVSVAGNITASTTSSHHPDINNSGISASLSISRYWTMTGGGGLTFSTYDGTFSFDNNDVDPGATPTSFIVAQLNGTWSLPTVGSALSNSTSATGLTAFGDFQVGEVQSGVTVTTATGGNAISSDDYTSGSWTTLTGPSLEEAVVADIGTGTIILDVPSGFEFDALNAGGPAPTVLVTGSGTATDNINNLSTGSTIAVTVSATQLTITISAVSENSAENTLTWQNVRVRPTAGYPLATGDITKSGTSVINGVIDNTTNFGTLTQVVGAIDNLVITLPGQTFNEGSGNAGSPTNRTAGTPFTITSVRATDQNFNTVTSYSGLKTISYTGPGGETSFTTAVTFVSGISTTTLSTTLYRAESTTITADDGTYSGPASSSVTVDPDLFSKMQILVPGETADPGSTGTGKTGTPSAQTAGSPFSVTVNAVDDYWNLITGAPNNTMTLTSSDGNAVMPAPAALASGTVTFGTVTLPTAGTSTITATNTTDGSKTADTSPSITVNVGAFARMQILVPGETADPGSATGKTGSPSGQTAGSSFSVTVNAVDANWNLVTAAPNNTVALTSSDANATMPAPAALSSGTVTFATVTLPTATTSTITATNSSDGTKTADTSPSITVGVGAFTKMQILVPGESASPGSATGKTGTPTNRTAGTAFSVTVNAVDANWNVVTAAPSNTITLTTSDGNATMPVPANLSSGTVTFATVTLPTATTSTMTATNTSDGTKTADTSPSITVDPGTITKLQVILPGETAVPGSATGKTGTPDASAIGVSLNFTVNGVDANWNVVTGASHTVSITSSDGAANLPSNDDLVSGTQTFSITLNTAGSQTITASATGLSAGVSASISVAAVVITSATGGSAISADDFGTGAWTALTGPAYDEAASGNVGTGTFILNAPSGFEFDQGGTAPTVLMTRLSGGGGTSRNINGVADATAMPITSISASQITFTVTSASNSGVTCRLTWQNVRVRPTAGTPLASGNLTKTGTATIVGLTNGSTNLGTLTQVHGAAADLIVTMPGETFTTGTGNSGTPSNQTANVLFNLVSVTVVDQYLNIATSDNSSRTLSYSGPSGSPVFSPITPSTVSFTSGVSTTTISATLYVVETATIAVDDGTISGSAGSSFTVLPQPTYWDGGGDGANWNDGANWSTDAVPTTYSAVILNGANTIALNATPTIYDITISHANLALTIPATYSLTVSNDFTQSNGTLSTETTFPSVSGTVTISGGTVAYTGAGQNVSPQTYYDLTMSGSGTKTLLGAVTINNDLTVATGVTLTDAGFQITGNASGALSLSGTAALTLGSAATGTSFPTNFVAGNMSISGTSTVSYSSDQAQTISALNYGNLTSSGIGNRTLPAGGTIGIAGTFTPSAGVYTSTGNTIDFNGAGAQSIPDFQYYNNLTTSNSGTKTIGGAITVELNLTVGGSTTLNVSASGTVQINNGDLNLNGSLQNDGTITIGL